MTTIRSEISKKKRKLMIVVYSGMALFIAGIIFTMDSKAVPVLPLIGFGISFVAMGYAFWGIRCPRCSGNFGYVAMYYGSPFSISKKIKYCPFCGTDIDTELKKQGEV